MIGWVSRELSCKRPVGRTHWLIFEGVLTFWVHKKLLESMRNVFLYRMRQLPARSDENCGIFQKSMKILALCLLQATVAHTCPIWKLKFQLNSTFKSDTTDWTILCISVILKTSWIVPFTYWFEDVLIEKIAWRPPRFLNIAIICFVDRSTILIFCPIA